MLLRYVIVTRHFFIPERARRLRDRVRTIIIIIMISSLNDISDENLTHDQLVTEAMEFRAI